MNGVSWLHVSDWHQRAQNFERRKVLDALLRDVSQRHLIDPGLGQLDFVVFSGDLAFSGAAEEYASAGTQLLDPLLEASGLDRSRLLVVPGNHDVSRSALEFIDTSLFDRLADEDDVDEILASATGRRFALASLAEYADFLTAFLPDGHAPSQDLGLGFVRRITIGNLRLGIAGFNSAWLSGHRASAAGEVDDQGALLVGEAMVHRALSALGSELDLRIAVVHHPLSWLRDFDQGALEPLLGKNFDFVLRGHEHRAAVRVSGGTDGSYIEIPAGATYDRGRHASTAGFNFVRIDEGADAAKIYLRRWNDVKSEWTADHDRVPGGCYSARLAGGPIGDVGTSRDADIGHQSLTDVPATAAAVAEYRTSVAKAFYFADHRGIAGATSSPFVAGLPVDDVYVIPRLQLADIEQREREQDLLKALEDPDLTGDQRERFEEEYAHLTGARWNSGAESEKGVPFGRVLRSTRQLVLIGSPGVGKSALLRFVARQAALGIEAMERTLGWSEELLPIYVPLAAFADARRLESKLPLELFVMNGIEDRGGAELRQAAWQALTQGRALVLLDGIDEVPSSTARAAVVRAVDDFLSYHRRSRCIVTSRPYGYVQLAGELPHYQLGNFSRAQVTRFVRNYQRAVERRRRPEAPDLSRAEDEATALLDDIASNSRVSELATNPLLLVIMALLRQETARLSEQRAELYNRAVNTLLDTWLKWKQTTEAQGEDVPIERLITVWSSVAAWMRAERDTGVVHEKDLRSRIERELKVQELEESGFSERAAAYFDAAAKSGILEERGPRIFGFWHPTFEEFLAAVRLATPTGGARERLLVRRFDPRWREAIRLAVGYVGVVARDPRTATELVEAVALTDVPARERLSGDALALGGGCIADYPGVLRPFAERFLTLAAEAVVAQPYEPFVDAFVSAARALGRLRPTSGELVERLVAAAGHVRWRVRMEAMRLLANIASENDIALRACRGGMDDADDDVACHAALGVLQQDASDERALELVLRNFDSSYAAVAPRARSVIASIDRETLRGFGTKAVATAPERARLLAKVGAVDEAVIAALKSSLTSGIPTVAASAAEILGTEQMTETQRVELRRMALLADDEATRVARVYLQLFGDDSEIVAALGRRASDGDAGLGAARVLLEHDPLNEDGLTAAGRACAGSSPNFDALEILEQAANALDAPETALSQIIEHGSEYQRLAATIILEHDTPDSPLLERALASLLRSSSSDIRRSALELDLDLEPARISPELRTLVRGLADDTDEDVRFAANRTLAQWEVDGACEALLAVAERDTGYRALIACRFALASSDVQGQLRTRVIAILKDRASRAPTVALEAIAFLSELREVPPESIRRLREMIELGDQPRSGSDDTAWIVYRAMEVTYDVIRSQPELTSELLPWLESDSRAVVAHAIPPLADRGFEDQAIGAALTVLGVLQSVREKVAAVLGGRATVSDTNVDALQALISLSDDYDEAERTIRQWAYRRIVGTVPPTDVE